jgi:hypothetical protein
MTPKYLFVALAIFLSFSSQAQVSGYLGKRKSVGVFADITPSYDLQYRASKKAIDYFTNSGNSAGGALGVHVRLGAEYTFVYKRRKQHAGSFEVFKNGIGVLYLVPNNGSETNPVFTTVRGVQFAYAHRTYGRKSRYSSFASGNIAPLGRFRGYGVQVKFYQFQLHDASEGEAFGAGSLKGIAPDFFYEFGRNRVIADKYVLTSSWRFGLYGLLKSLSIEDSSETYLMNTDVLRSEARKGIGWVDIYRFHLSFGLLK